MITIRASAHDPNHVRASLRGVRSLPLTCSPLCCVRAVRAHVLAAHPLSSRVLTCWPALPHPSNLPFFPSFPHTLTTYQYRHSYTNSHAMWERERREP